MARKRTRKKNTRRESRKREEEQIIDPRIREEIILIFICLFALLLFLSNLGFCGVLGEVLRQVQFILFGNFGFLFPFLLLFILIYYEKNKEKPGLFKSVMAIVVLYLLTESFFSVLFLGKEIPEDFYSLLQGGTLSPFFVPWKIGRSFCTLLFYPFIACFYNGKTAYESFCRIFRAYSGKSGKKSQGRFSKDIRFGKRGF